MPSTSGSFSRSCDSTVTTTWTSFLKPSTKSGTDRTVDETRDERLLLGRTAFTLEVAAGDLARRVGPLLVIHGQRKEIDAGLHGLGADDGGQNAGFAILREHRGIGLTGHTAGFEGQLAPAPFNFNTMDIEHVLSSFVRFF